MAIKPGYKTFTFDGERSGDYNTYITGSAVYNAPEREVEMIEIPGRNGAFALDKGRFRNIEITYPAGIYAESQEDFAEALSDLRNMLCSRTGYCRLEDEYNPEEYRMAVYKSGLDVDPAAFQRAGEFEITFECKPQRWLKSGEAKQTIATSGDTITNPTLFESSPLLEVKGYGDINIGDNTLSIIDTYVGDIVISERQTGSAVSGTGLIRKTFPIQTELLNIGDAFVVSGIRVTLSATMLTNISAKGIGSMDDCSATISGTGKTYTVDITGDNMNFVVGTPDTKQFYVNYYVETTGGELISSTPVVDIDYRINGSSHSIQMSLNFSATEAAQYAIPAIHADSTVSLLPETVYIDLDVGEVYYLSEDDGMISLNNMANLPAELPKLSSGSNEITYDNTITSLKVQPRWWKV